MEKPSFLQNLEAALQEFTSNSNGLSTEEATKRLEQYGQNKLPEEKAIPWFEILFEQFKSPLVYVLLAAAGISFFLKEEVDGIVILAAVLVQVIVGFIQEFRAQKSLAALKQVISLDSLVRRDGKERTIPALDVVPGDIMLLQAGDKIAADLRLLEVGDFETIEAALTGESEPIKKITEALADETLGIGDRVNMAFTGTVVTKGTAVGLVTATATNTEIGKIAQLIKETKEEETPLQQKLGEFSKKISIIIVVVALAIFGFGYFSGTNDLGELFITAVAVAVSAIPEGLAIAVTIILAVGMQRILKRDALVRKLVAAETLGSTDVICTDKTGTLTEGNMQVTDLVTFTDHYQLHELPEDRSAEFKMAMQIGTLCNDAKVNNPDAEAADWVVTGNLTERALIKASVVAGVDVLEQQADAKRIDEIPFESAIKYMATLHREVQGRMLYVKGAPEIVMQKCSKVLIDGQEVELNDDKHKQFEQKFIKLSDQGLRIIGVAYKHAGESAKTVEDAGMDELVFVAYVGIKDPLRAEAKGTVAKCKSAGIKTVMITGDHKLTAQAIARELGLEFEVENVVEGVELDALSDDELTAKVQDIAVYARVTPEHKLRIVHAWQAHGMVVAMTGDGINDSPAIKAADIGVALGSGTDVAKETADMVILDDNFDSIVEAVEEGRGIFDNIKKTVLYLVSDSFSEVVLIVGAILLGLPLPITAAQVLWINLVDDSFPSLAMTQEPKEPENMTEPPRGRKAQILDKEVLTLIVIISTITGLMNLGRFYYIYTIGGGTEEAIQLAQTVVFLSLGLDSLMYMFSVRSMRKMIWQVNPLSNKWMVGAFFMGLLFQVIPIYTPFLQPYLGTVPLGVSEWVVVVLMSFITLITIETVKYFFLHKPTREENQKPEQPAVATT